MQQISPNVYIETGYAGVTLGAISLPHGLALVDAPFLAEDIRAWRASLASLGGGVDRMLIVLDAHIDRLAGAAAMDCTVVGHEDLARIFQTRPFLYRTIAAETGAAWEAYENQGVARWAAPELSFSEEMKIHWGDTPILLQHCPGGEAGALWVHLPQDRILFLGDLVVPDQPPFLANGNIPAWIATLEKLLAPEYRNTTLVGGRSGLLRKEQVRWQIRFLEKVERQLEKMKEKGAPETEIEPLATKLLQDFEYPREMEALYLRRLQFGLTLYYLNNFFPQKLKENEE